MNREKESTHIDTTLPVLPQQDLQILVLVREVAAATAIWPRREPCLVDSQSDKCWHSPSLLGVDKGLEIGGNAVPNHTASWRSCEEAAFGA